MAKLYIQKNDPFCQRVQLAFAYAKSDCEQLVIADADGLPSAYAGHALPLVIDGEDVMDNSLEIMDWVLEPMEKASWIDWDLDEMDDSLYLLELCDGPFNDYLQEYLSADSPEQRIEAAECGVGFLKQLDELLQASEFLLKDHPMLVDFAVLPFVCCFVAQEPEFWRSNVPPRLGQWMETLLSDPVCQGVLK